MRPVKLLITNINAKLPTKGTKGSAYYDLYAAEAATILPQTVRLVSTGWKIEVPEGYFLDIRSRSGLASEGLIVANAPGTVDADYRGELKVILANISYSVKYVATGDRVAQCAVMPVVPTVFNQVSKLSETKRGENGYGSTGR